MHALHELQPGVSRSVSENSTQEKRLGLLRNFMGLVRRSARAAGPASTELSKGIAQALQQLQSALRNVSSPVDMSAPSQSGAIVVDEGRFVSRTYRSQAGERSYKLYVPASRFLLRRAPPLIVMLHGCTQSPDDFANGTRMNELAQAHGFVAVYPEQDEEANPSRCWNWFRPEDQRHGEGEPAIIAGIARQAVDELALDASRMYVVGMSAGGAMAVTVAHTYPKTFAAVGCHSGLAYAAARDVASAFRAMRTGSGSKAPSEFDADSRRIPTIVFHGKADAKVDPRNGLDVVEQALCCQAEAYPYPVNLRSGADAKGRRYRQTIYLDANERSVVEHWSLDGVGHAWSGGSSEGSNTDPHGIDASSEMVKFFLRHSLTDDGIAPRRDDDSA